MRYLYTNKKAKELDSHAIQTIGMPSLVLMERAAMSVAAYIIEKERKGIRVLAVCGTGNNGGDGIAVARILHEMGFETAITIVGETERMTSDTKSQFLLAVHSQVPVVSLSSIKESSFDVLVDGIFGVGLTRKIEGVYAEIIETMNQRKAKIYAIDTPSGVNGTTGEIMGTAIQADYTVTFGFNKVGLVLYPGCEKAGEITVADIGFPRESKNKVRSTFYHYEPFDLPYLLPRRPLHSHKGTFGKVLVVAGSQEMSGACYLAAKTAYCSGAGLVKAVSTENNREILLNALPEVLFTTREYLKEGIEWADSVVIGPGIGLSDEAKEMVRYVLDNCTVPTVLDGDAIRLCAQLTDLLTDNFIVTPHVKEMSYLTGMPVSKLQDDLPGTTKDTAREFGCIIVQKDARTIVSNGEECYINVSGNHGMATGGSGDVLAGMLGGLLAQKMEPFQAAKVSVYVHGLGGDMARKKKGTYALMASDIIDGIVNVLATQEEDDKDETR